MPQTLYTIITMKITFLKEFNVLTVGVEQQIALILIHLRDKKVLEEGMGYMDQAM
jgi:hypothetical protein